MGRSQPENYSFVRYLASKKSVDDRVLNNHVWQTLENALARNVEQENTFRVLEIGAGVGTMLERMLERELFCNADYTGLDISDEHLKAATKRLLIFAEKNGFEVTQSGQNFELTKKDHRIQIAFTQADIFEYLQEGQGKRSFDLLVAHAFLDLMHLTVTLPQLFTLLRVGGLFYFSGNYDGSIEFEPSIDPELEEVIQSQYCRTMDERVTYGQIAGDPHAGRHLFTVLRQVGANVLDAGSSDWVVYSNDKGYPGDEIYFLHFIVNSVQILLNSNTEVDPKRIVNWVQERHSQIRCGDLVLIAHQLDFVGYWE